MTGASAGISAAERERLENCVREPIRRPGSIQPHGVLLTLDRASWTIVQTSGNADAFLGAPGERLRGTAASELIGRIAVERLDAVLAGALGASNPVPLEIGGRLFDAIVHETDGVVVLELERALPHHEFASIPAVYAAAGRLPLATTREKLWADVAREMRALTGFDRVMVYHFHADGHGQVVAEERADEALEPYLGLHYPASDIPAQARQLYLTKCSRTIYSTDEMTYSIEPAESPVTGEVLDLSRAELRSVSPHHRQFMRNMGQASTLSFSLIAGGDLIGMITCAHRSPRRLPYALRQSLEVFANQVAVHLSAMSEISRLTREGELFEMRSRLVEQLAASTHMAQGLLRGAVTLLDLVPAAGAALHLDGRTSTIGDAPEQASVERVVERLRADSIRMPFATDCLATDLPQIAELMPTVAGLLIVPFDGGKNYLAWFRPEIIETTEWLGDQSEANRETTLSPRTSFSAWSRSVSGRAQPWQDHEGQAIEFGYDLDSALLRRRESTLARLGLHDALTGLPNRRLLTDRLEQALHGGGRRAVALLFIDIDAFKGINDSLGHDRADIVLRQIAERLLSVSRETDTVARLGGDEFVILCESTDRKAALGVAERVLAALHPPFEADGQTLLVTASVGVAAAQEGDMVSDLLRRADASMYRAKRSGKNQAAG